VFRLRSECLRYVRLSACSDSADKRKLTDRLRDDRRFQTQGKTPPFRLLAVYPTIDDSGNASDRFKAKPLWSLYPTVNQIAVYKRVKPSRLSHQQRLENEWRQVPSRERLYATRLLIDSGLQLAKQKRPFEIVYGGRFQALMEEDACDQPPAVTHQRLNRKKRTRRDQPTAGPSREKTPCTDPGYTEAFAQQAHLLVKQRVKMKKPKTTPIEEVVRVFVNPLLPVDTEGHTSSIWDAVAPSFVCSDVLGRSQLHALGTLVGFFQRLAACCAVDQVPDNAQMHQLTVLDQRTLDLAGVIQCLDERGRKYVELEPG
jgi:hypothetical protein